MTPAPQRAQRVRGVPGVGLRTPDGREWLRWGRGFRHDPDNCDPVLPPHWVIARCSHPGGGEPFNHDTGLRWTAWDGPNKVVSLAATIDLRDEVFAEHPEHGVTFPSEAWADVIACAQVANGTAHDSELLAALFDAGIDPCDATVYVPNPCAVWQLFAIEWTRAKYVARIDANP